MATETAAPPNRTAASTRRRVAFAAIAALIALKSASSQCHQGLRGDDWAYLQWAREHPAWDAFLTTPPPYPFFRPLNALLWELQGHWLGASSWGLETALILMWLAVCALLWSNVRARADPVAALVAVMLAVATPELRDLPNWRSWLTTTGELFGLLAALTLAAGSRPSMVRGVGILALLAVGAGFKEAAWWNGAWGLFALGELPLAGIALALFAVQAAVTTGLHTPGDIALAHVPVNLPLVVHTLLGWRWPAGLAILALGTADGRRVTGARWVAAALAAVAPSLAFYLYNPYYILEAAVLLLVALVPGALASARHAPVFGALVAVGLAVALTRDQAWDDYRENVPYQAAREAAASALVRRALDESAPQGVWAPPDDPGACPLAAQILAYDHGVRLLPERPAAGRQLEDCLVIAE